MKTIIDDPEGFFESGGWSFLDPNSGSEDEKDEDEDLDSEDEEFKVKMQFGVSFGHLNTYRLQYNRFGFWNRVSSCGFDMSCIGEALYEEVLVESVQVR